MNKGTLQTILILLGVFAVTGLIIWGLYAADQSKEAKYEKMSSREVALQCTTDMATKFHIHPELAIVIDGVKQVIPSDVGIADGCMNSLHTHDSTGVFHVEAPVKKDFTLGDFFAVWKQPFDAMHILDKTATAAGQVTMTINGEPVDTFENTLLKDLDKIEIKYTSSN